MARFIQDSNRIVPDAINGRLATARADGVTRLDGFDDVRVVLRKSVDPNLVAVISGGGSGHEPAHVGFVGAGMLTAAVAGDVFASPNVDAVLAGILAVTGEAGCLLIVKNYTGDRLNFGLAAERAKQRGLNVEMVIVADDVALGTDVSPRGIAGTLFAHKVAGYYADRGESLASVKQQVEAALARAASIGIALASCDSLSQPVGSSEPRPELGLGIHGEPGASIVDFERASEAIDAVIQPLANNIDADTPLALILNNLGGVSAIEMDILKGELMRSSLGRRTRLLIGPAVLMSSLNMPGFSVSVLALTEELEAALIADVEPSAWVPAKHPDMGEPVPMPDLGKGAQPDAESDEATEKRLRAIVDTLITHRNTLDELDKHVGDGDAGNTFAAGARAVQKALDDTGLPLATPNALMVALGEIAEAHMGGSSGVLLSIMLTTAGNDAEQDTPVAVALQRGVAHLQAYSGAEPGDRTLLDALVPGLEKLVASGSVAEAAKAARDGAEKTRQMAARAGRSAYLREESLANYPDPGAVAIALAFEAVAGAEASL